MVQVDEEGLVATGELAACAPPRAAVAGATLAIITHIYNYLHPTVWIGVLFSGGIRLLSGQWDLPAAAAAGSSVKAD